MVTAALQPARECLNEWNSKSGELEAELRDSLDALDALQRQLDAWQQALAAEREGLNQERQRLEAERQHAADQAAGAANAAAHSDEQLAELERELASWRQRSAELEATLAAGEHDTLGLRDENARLASEAELARQSQAALEADLERTRAELAQQNQHWTQELGRVLKLLEEEQASRGHAEPGPAPVQLTPTTPPSASTDPVLGSVVAQFGKLRQQRAERGLR